LKLSGYTTVYNCINNEYPWEDSIKSLLGFFFGDVFLYQINWTLILKFTFISILGIFIGNYFSVFINAKLLKKIFGVFIFIVGFLIITNELINL